MRFKRPPRSSKEAISALKEADRRYQMNKSALIGRNRKSINHEDLEKLKIERDEKQQDRFLENVPKGI